MTWFVHHEERIRGPFSTEQVLKNLKSGELSYSSYIWSKGQVAWLPAAEWEASLESLNSLPTATSRRWRLRDPKRVKEDLSFDEVVEILKSMKNFKLIAVTPMGDDEWSPIYSNYAFMEALNLSRRHFLRAPIMGISKVTRFGSRFSYIVKTATLGMGGIGIYGLGPNFQPGTQVELKVESEDISASISVNGTVAYNTDQGFIGVRFTDLSEDSLAVISKYISQFNNQEPEASFVSDQSAESEKAS